MRLGPSADMRSRLGWMTLSNNRRMLRAICVIRYMRGDGPAYMANMFRTHKDLGLRSARRENDIYLTIPRSNWMAKSFSYRAGMDWNSLPTSIKNASNYTFRSKIKQ